MDLYRISAALMLAMTVFLGTAAGAAGLFPQKKTPSAAMIQEVAQSKSFGDTSLSPVIPEHEEGVLLALVETEEEAAEIAALYNITLEQCDHGLARYTTDRDVVEVYREGIEKGWPPLYLNLIYQSYATPGDL